MATRAEISKRDTHVLIMCGQEYRFLEATQWFEDHFRDNVKIPEEKVSVIRCAYRDHNSTVQHMHDFLVKPSQAEPTNIVLAYIGHGNVGRMSPNAENPIYYEELACMLGEHNGHFVFINGSCYSGSSIDIIVAQGLHKKGLILTSVPNDESVAGNSFEQHVLEAYQNGAPFYPTADMGTPLITIEPLKEKRIEREGKIPLIILDFGSELEMVGIPQRKGKRLDYLLYPK